MAVVRIDHHKLLRTAVLDALHGDRCLNAAQRVAKQQGLPMLEIDRVNDRCTCLWDHGNLVSDLAEACANAVADLGVATYAK